MLGPLRHGMVLCAISQGPVRSNLSSTQGNSRFRIAVSGLDKFGGEFLKAEKTGEIHRLSRLHRE